MTIESLAYSPEDNPINGIESISNEERLIEKINRYFTNIYNTHYTVLLGNATFRLSDAQLAEDIVSEVFTNFYDYLLRQRKDPEILIQNINSYLFRCLTNKIIDFYRKNHRTSPIDGGFRSPSNTHQSVEDQLREERNFEIINHLVENQKIAFLMFYNGFSQKEIAKEIYGGSLPYDEEKEVNKVKSLLSRARKTLKKYLSGYCGDGSL
jgi:RNA polymerase sigma factor (sigma-70 family)